MKQEIRNKKVAQIRAVLLHFLFLVSYFLFIL
jgi:hypothetical protein